MNTTPKPNVLRAAATYGLYIGLFLILCHFISSVSGGKVGFLMLLIKLVGSISLLVYGMKRYRDVSNRGYITYGNAFGFGMLTSLFSTFLYTAYLFVTTVSSSAAIQEQLYVAYDDFIERGLIDEEFIVYLVENMNWLVPTAIFIWSMFLGLIYSLIIAAALVRKKSVFES